ncbi:hypothetical protein OOT00_15545 [Desulfobotulus sp. H1]|uniref:Histidine-specific methyltransferase SAM-dependent domain-containing protein n=1 Tax=Desulfobotulus pelophilus TaxID=2823377 RepID=A0ABT3ND50_9BACT|nr:hypothetical protein [Desulfobotulus pelophilus]MCW7755395.1 hypothetical protein [Desulfobotulus pelophilus]
MTSMPDALQNENLRHIVVEALAGQTNVPKERIVCQPNKDKYCNKNNPSVVTPELDEVFYLMRALNARALRDSRTASDEMGRHNFSVTMERFATDIADAIHDRPFTYVEMGPEPVKTTCLIRNLRTNGVRLTGYIGIDINPASEKPMREALAPMMDPFLIHFCFRDFSNLSQSDIHRKEFPSLVTMLGFQEGNEHPDAIVSRLKRIVLPGDLVASEMHVSTQSRRHKLEKFYESAEMKRFSRLAFERMVGTCSSEYAIHTLDIDVGLKSPVPICVTSESFEDPDTGEIVICVTNWCLKFSALQHRVVREAISNLIVIAERRTGDRTVSFQLAEAIADEAGIVDIVEPFVTTLQESAE